MFRTDDPHRDFDSWDNEQQTQLEELPLCHNCEEPIQDGYYYEIGGMVLCVECLNDNYRKSVDDYLDSLED